MAFVTQFNHFKNLQDDILPLLHKVSINHKNAEHSIRFNTNFAQKEVMSEATNGHLYPCLLFSLGHTTCFNQRVEYITKFV